MTNLRVHLYELEGDKQDCSASEFRCASGQCVSDSMRCDGHPDCWDHSDEKSCTKQSVCTTKYSCPQSHECLILEWICDGDKDCKDGTDEKVRGDVSPVQLQPHIPFLPIALVPFTILQIVAQW